MAPKVSKLKQIMLGHEEGKLQISNNGDFPGKIFLKQPILDTNCLVRQEITGLEFFLEVT